MNVELTTDDFKVLYCKRWGIEVKYSQLKSRYELENFSGVGGKSKENSKSTSLFIHATLFVFIKRVDMRFQERATA
ncbi:hypothetical protein [Sporomusa sp. KB1]|jgi:hypothetical protein|uniref:hypothetical protein n=1 Tax=Sporomusa sp. KB1 TaxID=943346 RepID=UPI001C9749A8|nr:hypothetical protein [Sporomusa sp. KB1]